MSQIPGLDRPGPARTGSAGSWVPAPLDGGALALSAAGTGLLVTTMDAGWTLLLLLACAMLALGSGAAVWLISVLGLSGLGWAAAFGRAVVETSPWAFDDIVGWARAGLALALAVTLAALTRRRLHRNRIEVDQALAFAQDATVHDPLTGLANRKGLLMLGAHILESARRRGDALYCMFLDVDGLARVNAEVDHQAGDEVLLTVAEALSRSTRATDAVARWGGDEFVVVGPGTGLAPLEMERRVRARCLEHSPVARSAWQARISAGSAVLEPWDDGDVEVLVRAAGREMRLRRALRREAAAPPYRPVRRDQSPRPPEPRHPWGSGE